MTKREFVDIIQKLDLPFEEVILENHPEYDGVYVCNRKEYELKKKHPIKYKDLYVSYVRVSHFDEDRLYVKHNGYVCYMNEQDVMDIIRDLAS